MAGCKFVNILLDTKHLNICIRSELLILPSPKWNPTSFEIGHNISAVAYRGHKSSKSDELSSFFLFFLRGGGGAYPSNQFYLLLICNHILVNYKRANKCP